jgi:hypothetical protein
VAASGYARVLWLSLGLFALRVVAQPLSLVVRSHWLPAFDAWQSGAVPYWLLLLSQIAILAVFVPGTVAVARGTAQLRRRSGVLLFAVGTMYLMSMITRLALGMTAMRGHAWFDRPIPTSFHLVLATSVMVYARFQWRYGRR